jgi:hypothetical protein
MHPKLSIIAVLALSWSASEARAQAARPWTVPNGAFTVTIPAGWAEVTDREVSEGTLLIIGSAANRRNLNDFFRECVVFERPMPDVRPSAQSDLNARGAEATAPDLFPDVQVASFTKETRGGVLVTSGKWINQGTWETHSVFALATNNGPVLYRLACGATGGAEAGEDMAAMTRFVESVTFHR